MRLSELDFAKGVLIILMVMFHLTYSGTFMPQTVDPFVYSFHVSSFMLLSGFLFKPDKSWSAFWKSYRYLLLLYLLFDLSDYLLVATLGGIMGSSSQLHLGVSELLNVIFISPAGTYWYIHSLLWMYLAYWLIHRLPINGGGKLILLLVVLWAVNINDKLPWNMYFALGCAMRMLSTKIEKPLIVFSPTWVAFFPLVLIALFNKSFTSDSLTGLATVLSFLSLIMWVYGHCGNKVSHFVNYIGRNTLSILLFSPFLTIFAKFAHRLFEFDPSEIVYAVFSTTMVIMICLLAAFVWDKIGIKKIFGRDLYCKF